jgi:hypothetical protein
MFALQTNFTKLEKFGEKEMSMEKSAKRWGMTILVVLGTVLALAVASAASAVWGS